MHTIMKSRLNINIFIVLMGLLWGVTELTAGYLLHLLHIPIAGAFLMPVGVISMLSVYLRGGSKSALFLVSLIAASVKLITIFFVPVTNFYLVINPVVAILLEGLIMIIPITIIFKLKSHRVPGIFIAFFAAILFYKFAFISFQALLSINTGAPALGGLNIIENSGFLFIETLISSVIITGSLFFATTLAKVPFNCRYYR